MDGWNTNCLSFNLGWPIFTGGAVSFREGNHPKKDTTNCQLVGGFNPLEKYAQVKLDHFPK